jgi:hypothetical protein
MVTPEVAPARPSWNSQGRLATETPSSVKAQPNMGKRPLALDLSQDFTTSSHKRRNTRQVSVVEEQDSGNNSSVHKNNLSFSFERTGGRKNTNTFHSAPIEPLPIN